MSSRNQSSVKEKPFYAASLISQKSRLYNTLLYPLFLQTFQRPVFPPLLSAAFSPMGNPHVSNSIFISKKPALPSHQKKKNLHKLLLPVHREPVCHQKEAARGEGLLYNFCLQHKDPPAVKVLIHFLLVEVYNHSLSCLHGNEPC